MKRKHYITGSFDEFKEIIESIKTEEDLTQLQFDILSADTNLVKMEQGYIGVCSIAFLGRIGTAYRHIFMTVSAYNRFGDLGDAVENEFSWSIVQP